MTRQRFLIHLALIGAALLGSAAVWIATARYGPGLSPDAVHYLAAARAVVDGQGWINARGTPLLSWPPLYPTILALLHAVGLPLELAARGVNAAAHGALVWLVGRWLMSHLPVPGLAPLAALAVAASPGLLDTASYAWSEPLFMLWTVLALMASVRWLKGGRQAELIYWGLWTGLAFGTRYAAAPLILLAALLILFTPTLLRARRLPALALFGALSLWITGPWWLRCWGLSGTLMGHREAAHGGPLSASVQSIAHTVWRWWVPGAEGGVFTQITVAGLLLGAVLWGWAAIKCSGEAMQWVRSPALLPWGLFIPCYLIFMLLVGASVALDALDQRLLIPLWVPLVVVLWHGLSALWQSHGRAGRALLGVALILWLGAYPLLASASMVAYKSTMGAGGYATTPWQQARIVELLRSGHLAGRVLSNMPEVVYHFSAVRATLTPKRGSLDRDDEVARFKAGLADDLAAGTPVRVIWFNNPGRHFLTPQAELVERLDLQPIGSTGDAVVYRLLSSTVRSPKS